MRLRVLGFRRAHDTSQFFTPAASLPTSRHSEALIGDGSEDPIPGITLDIKLVRM